MTVPGSAAPTATGPRPGSTQGGAGDQSQDRNNRSASQRLGKFHSILLDRGGYDGDWAQRSAVAVAGILANDAKEAFYAFTREDIDGVKLDGSKANYTLTFPAGALPPVNAFWSVTMYDGNTRLLVENPINRYLINLPMLPELNKNADGSLTLFIQKDEPTDPLQKANWLPAPNGPVYTVLRMYWPKASVLNGSWEPPGIQAVK